MAGLTKIYTDQRSARRPAQRPERAQLRQSGLGRAVAIALLLGCFTSSSLTGCRSAQLSALQAETSPEELATVLPREIPPAPSPVAAATTLSRAATTADSDLLPQAPKGNHQGPFRVGNQTQRPLRIALQTRLDPETQKAINPEGLDLEPIHWDFAPGEGGQSGLLMSVEQGDVELRNGDVLVAFAQDGSRRYWGPYIVGETQLPYWDEERSEWQLLIQP